MTWKWHLPPATPEMRELVMKHANHMMAEEEQKHLPRDYRLPKEGWTKELEC